MTDFVVHPVGSVQSPLSSLDAAPRQGDEGAPDAWLTFAEAYADAVRDVRVGDEILLLTWLDRAERDVLRVHPRGDIGRPVQGVFSTRSPHRPNPIGLHRVTVLAVEEGRWKVSGLEAIDGTPILDVKPALGPVPER